MASSVKQVKFIFSTISILLFFSTLVYSQKASNQIYKVNEFDKLLIMPLGNSITYDFRINDIRAIEDKFGYRFPLYNLLKNTTLNFDFIGSEHAGSNFLPQGFDDNAGFPGIKDNQLANLLETGWRVQPPDNNYQITSGPYLETYLPDVILLHIGTNGNNEIDGTSASDIEDILDEVDRVENLLNKDIPVIVARIIDRVPNQEYVNTLNNNIETMILDRINNSSNPAYPDLLYLVDMEDGAGLNYTISPDPNGSPGDMNDYLHPNNKGYEKMANVWFDAIMQVYSNPITSIVQPNNVYSIVGEKATFSVDVNSLKPVFYQWKQNGIDIDGANSSIYVINDLLPEDNNRVFYCEIQSGFYIMQTDSVFLNVTNSTERVSNGLIAEYDFEQSNENMIENNVNNYPNLKLNIKNPSAINWLPYGIDIIDNPAITTINQAKDICREIVENNEITVEAWIVPNNASQSGPARIITFSQNVSNRNFSLNQESDKYEVRLRTTKTDNNGLPSLFSSSNSAKDKLTHVVFTKNIMGELSIYVNGSLDTKVNISGSFSNWDSTYSFGLADEFLNERLWLGKFYLVSLYNRALNPQEVLHNFNIKFKGYDFILEKPSNLTVAIENGTNVLVNWDDNSSNELGFIIERRANQIDSLFYIIDSLSYNATSFIDSTIKYDSSYVYRVRAFNDSTFSEYSEEAIINDLLVSVKNNNIVNKFDLYQNYPNPFNPTTNLKFSLTQKSEVELKIFNSIGEIVEIIYDNKILPEGINIEIFNAKNLASGVYFYRLIAKPLDGSPVFMKINKATLIK
ncbi:MAG: LamG-like jellyroll fold domain-containing protein [Melioribacteraceae bacterium]